MHLCIEAENGTKKETPSRASGTKVKKETTTKDTKVKKETGATASPVKGGRGKKKEEEREVWKWWEEEPHPEGVKWLTLEHRVCLFTCLLVCQFVYLSVYLYVCLLVVLLDLCNISPLGEKMFPNLGGGTTA